MISRLAPALLLSLAAAAPEASQQTYKWVDARGVVNYSNAPPAEAAARVKTVEQRISIIGPDPSVGLAAAAMREREARRAEYEEREWQRRQSALLMQQTSVSANCYQGANCGAGDYLETYYPYFCLSRLRLSLRRRALDRALAAASGAARAQGPLVPFPRNRHARRRAWRQPRRAKLLPLGAYPPDSTGRPAARHSGKPSCRQRAFQPRCLSFITASNDIRQYGPRQ